MLSSASPLPSGSAASTVGPCRCRAPTDATNVAARLVRGWDLEPVVAAHLAHFYGSRADHVLGLAADRPELLERVHPDAPDIGAQVVFAMSEEWATDAADVLHRRTTWQPVASRARRSLPGSRACSQPRRRVSIRARRGAL